jgi:phosphosulfolactate synthase (CoM biosynthesis protein A)
MLEYIKQKAVRYGGDVDIKTYEKEILQDYEDKKGNRKISSYLRAFEIISISKSYLKATTEDKKKYIELFWERFEVENQEIVEDVPSKFIKSLLPLDSKTVMVRKKIKWYP